VLGLLAASLVALVACEIWFRLTLEHPPGYFEFPEDPAAESEVQIPHPTRVHAYRPDFSGSVTHSDRQVDFRTNSQGFRDRPFDEDPDAWRILAVGSSFTLGWGLDAEASWPAQLERELNQGAAPEGRVRVLNSAVTGYNLAQLRVLTEELLPELKPELVIVGISTRSAGGLGEPRVRIHGRDMNSSEAAHLIPDSEGFFRTLFDAPLLRRADHWLAHNLLVGSFALRAVGRSLHPAPRRKEHQDASHDDLLIAELERLHQVTRSAVVPLVVLPIDHQRKNGTFPGYLRRRSARILEYCAAQDLSCLDVHTTFESEAAGRPVFRQGRDIHWSAQAHRIAAQELAALLRAEDLVPAGDARWPAERKP
jgi:hypothetical protein